MRRLLSEGWEVHALLGRTCLREALDDIDKGITVHLHDGTMEGMNSILEVTSPDVVFHLASCFLADHRPDQIGELIASNILFSTQLAEAMARNGVRFIVNTGTSWQHFGTTGYHPVNLYAATKQAFEDILFYYYNTHGMSCLTLKLFDTYGNGDPRSKLVNLLLKSSITGISLDMSPGDQIIDLVHVDDVATAFLVGAERLLGDSSLLYKDYFISGTRLTVKKLADVVTSVTGKCLDIRWGGRPYRDREVMQLLDVEDRLLPGWAPRVHLSDGLKNAYFVMRGDAVG